MGELIPSRLSELTGTDRRDEGSGALGHHRFSTVVNVAGCQLSCGGSSFPRGEMVRSRGYREEKKGGGGWRERRLKEESRVVRAAERVLVVRRARPVAGRLRGGDESSERTQESSQIRLQQQQRATGPPPRQFRPAEARSRFAARTAQGQGYLSPSPLFEHQSA